jgi:hypothetical protein
MARDVGRDQGFLEIGEQLSELRSSILEQTGGIHFRERLLFPSLAPVDALSFEVVQKNGEDVIAEGTVFFVGKAFQGLSDAFVDLERDDHFHTLPTTGKRLRGKE